MKTIMLIFLMVMTTAAHANDEKYFEQMGKQIQIVYRAQTTEELQGAVNALERIASAEKTKWEPHYYSAFGYLMMATREKESSKKDSYLDQALAAVERGKALVPQESELVALEGFVHMIRVTVDPATRGAQYSGLAMQTFGKAVSLNPNNPRVLALMAQMQFGTAQFFGSSTAEACGIARKASDQFKTYKSENPLAPVWGKEMNEELIKSCH